MKKKAIASLLISLGVISLFFAFGFYLNANLLDPKDASDADDIWPLVSMVLGLIGIAFGLIIFKKYK